MKTMYIQRNPSHLTYLLTHTGAQLAISKRGGDGDQEDGGSGGTGATLEMI